MTVEGSNMGLTTIGLASVTRLNRVDHSPLIVPMNGSSCLECFNSSSVNPMALNICVNMVLLPTDQNQPCQFVSVTLKIGRRYAWPQTYRSTSTVSQHLLCSGPTIYFGIQGSKLSTI
eukprot:GHVT01086873.1.p2 GENE.GHVT01086873.1~~GHVT01086873.1.p2  ORF type:complete len:118 (-),score=0.02 GHVT01086873.1:711-1064(-)